ncbi:MAG: bifunctional tetrahydrofolate synthase/dihydrofolate synthase [Nitrosospira sp.]
MSEPDTKSRTLSDWLNWLERIHPKTIEMGLDRINRVKADLNLACPFPIITIGGTNGKGSTCAMMEAILTRAGYRVGCYTSPHLLRYNERVRVNRKEASDDKLCDAFQMVESARLYSDTPLTYFEFGTLAAMQLFKQAEVEVAIMEVGLGGRLDAVNIFDADCAVITSVDFDHMDYLGTTLEEIGFEKAGIFRSGKVAICSEPDIPATVRLHAEATGANLMRIGEHFGYSTSATAWSFWGDGGKRHSLPYPALRGAYQLRNASACLAALDAVKDSLPITMGDVRQGLLEVVWPGRFQVLPGRPMTVLDVAHNPGAARALAADLDNMGRYQKTYAVFAMLKDKDITGVARALAPQVDVWLTASINLPRGAAVGDVAQALKEAGVVDEAIQSFSDPVAAYAFACEQATGNDRICVFGSFHTVAEVLRSRNVVEHG